MPNWVRRTASAVHRFIQDNAEYRAPQPPWPAIAGLHTGAAPFNNNSAAYWEWKRRASEYGLDSDDLDRVWLTPRAIHSFMGKTHKGGKHAHASGGGSSSSSTASSSGGAGGKSSERQMRNEMRRNRRKEDARRTWAVDVADLQKFQTQLAPLGLELRDVIGDGNCLFRALADQISGDAQGGHKPLREEIVQYIRTHRDDLEPFLEAEEEESFEDYVEDLGKDGFYAGHWALVAASRLLGANVFIHQIGQPIWKIMAADTTQPAYNNHSRQRTRTLHVAYYGWEHYSSIRRIGGPYEGPADIEIAELAAPAALGAAAAGKRKDKDTGSSSASSSSASTLSFSERTIMQSTGFTDIERIRNCLAVRNGDLNSALDDIMAIQAEDEAVLASTVDSLSTGTAVDPEEELIQAMYRAAVGDDDDGSSSAATASSSTPAPAPAPPAAPATTAAPADATKASSSSSSSSSSKKQPPATGTSRMSNAKRKEQLKKERKERRHDEQRQAAAPPPPVHVPVEASGILI